MGFSNGSHCPRAGEEEVPGCPLPCCAYQRAPRLSSLELSEQSPGAGSPSKLGLSHPSSTANQRDKSSEKQKSEAPSMWPHWNKEAQGPSSPPLGLDVRFRFNGGHGVRTVAELSSPGQSVAPPIADPGLCGLRSLPQGGLQQGSQDPVEMFSWRINSPQAVTRLQGLPSPSLRFLGKFQFLGDYCFSIGWAKGGAQGFISLLLSLHTPTPTPRISPSPS